MWCFYISRKGIFSEHITNIIIQQRKERAAVMLSKQTGKAQITRTSAFSDQDFFCLPIYYVCYRINP